MLELFTDPQAWASLLTLTALEIVLGIDNIIFISIVAARLPAAQQDSARRIGLGAALVMRLILLASIAWIVGLTAPVFTVFDFAVSWRDLIMGRRPLPARQGHLGNPPHDGRPPIGRETCKQRECQDG